MVKITAIMISNPVATHLANTQLLFSCVDNQRMKRIYIKINHPRLTWVSIFSLSLIVLILRVIDFAGEASDLNFHITRAGLNIMGANAIFIQLTIIFASAWFMWKALEKLYAFPHGKLGARI